MVLGQLLGAIFWCATMCCPLGKGVILLDLGLYGELRLELNIGPSSPAISGVFLGLQNC